LIKSGIEPSARPTGHHFNGNRVSFDHLAGTILHRFEIPFVDIKDIPIGWPILELRLAVLTFKDF